MSTTSARKTEDEIAGVETLTPGQRPPENARTSGDGGFLSRSAVARQFGVSASTVTRWARTGLIPSIRTPGGHYRFRADEIRRAASPFPAGESVKPD